MRVRLKITNFMLILLMLLSMVTPSMAATTTDDDVYVTVITYYPNVNDPDDITDTTTWTKYETFDLNKGETQRSIYDIEFYDISNDYGTVLFRITNSDDNDNEEEVYLKEGASDVVGLLRIKVDTIEEGSTSGGTTSATSSSSSPVKVYVEVENNVYKSIPTNGYVRYNPATYSSDDGWESSSEDRVVPITVERTNTKVDLTYSITTLNGNKAYEYFDDEDNLIVEVNDDDTYTITITYDKENVWGGVATVNEKYELILEGMDDLNVVDDSDSSSGSSGSGTSGGSSSSSGDEAPVSGTYIVTLGNSKVVKTTMDGSWNTDSGYSVSSTYNEDTEQYEWTFDFDAVGTYTADFTTTKKVSGYEKTGSVTFKVKEASTTSASQTSSNTSSNISNILIIAGLLVVVGVAGKAIMNKRRRGGSGGFQPVQNPNSGI